MTKTILSRKHTGCIYQINGTIITKDELLLEDFTQAFTNYNTILADPVTYFLDYSWTLEEFCRSPRFDNFLNGVALKNYARKNTQIDAQPTQEEERSPAYYKYLEEFDSPTSFALSFDQWRLTPEAIQ